MDDALKMLEHPADERKLSPSDRNLDHDQHLAAYRGPMKSRVAFPCHDLPIYDDNVFCGRHVELDLIDDAISPPLEGIIRQRAFCIYGIGGVGKSRLALAYASRFGYKFDAIFVIQSEDNLAVSGSFTRIDRKLRLREQDQGGNAEEDNELVQQWLQESGMWRAPRYDFPCTKASSPYGRSGF
ncbi:hypothetical protein MMC30_007768 [Trapelia coarctata]|nr:hypothetical protein [Trapelia coarctata]